MYKRHLYDGNLDDRKPTIRQMAQRFFKGACRITPAQYREFFESACRECGTDNGGRRILCDRIDSHARYVIGKMGIALDKDRKAERVCGRKAQLGEGKQKTQPRPDFVVCIPLPPDLSQFASLGIVGRRELSVSSQAREPVLSGPAPQQNCSTE